MLKHIFVGVSLSWLLVSIAQAEVAVDRVTRMIRSAEKSVVDPKGWAVDLLDVLRQHQFEASLENLCAAIAVIDQESGFVADPAVPGLGKLSEAALRDKLGKIPLAGGTAMRWLENNPTPNTSFITRIRNARTERDLDLVYRALIAYGGEKSGTHFVLQLGAFNQVIEERNDIDTAGSMQVSVKFALDMAKRRRWLPMLLDDVYGVRDQLYTRHGGMYYGVAQLLGYETGYDKKVYRFADFNAGRYASRNAAIQLIVSRLAKTKLALDGDLLSYGKNGKPLSQVTETEKALQGLSQKLGWGLSPGDIRNDLLLEKDKSFAATKLSLLLRESYGRAIGKQAPLAVVPEITLASPKIKRKMTTRIFAETVAKRYFACVRVK